MKRPKEHTGSFFLEPPLLEILDAIAQFEGQSRGVIVECAIRYFLQGEKHDWQKSKRNAYNKKGPQKVHAQTAHHRPLKGQGKKGSHQPKRPLARKRFKGPRSVFQREPLYPSLFAQQCSLQGFKGLK
ncbi:ribbon-helix-helix domain-containing protein [Helicobacter mehlei]|uniref:ribbon-helix-helix domain-containing protein n=1 Tax=Helicobacter mehlei TaxID=2316080 RepID=UPI0013CE0136|nr:ribbon-helix-helix domain-containing protein [Helicobacter mehlei]